MAKAAAGRVLDVTRLVRRVGRPVLTGIDRVERAYLREFLAGDRAGVTPCLLQMRWLGRCWLLPAAYGEDILAALNRPGRASSRRLSMSLALRALSSGSARRVAVSAARHLGGGWVFFTGHLGPDAELRDSWQRAGIRVAVFLHDTIPLDFPQHSRPHAIRELSELLLVAAGCDLVLCSSRAVAADLARHGVTGAEVIPLGLEMPQPDAAQLPERLRHPDRPVFLALGTIEPRKNHDFLLDLWQALEQQQGADCPLLVIAGRRGWQDPAFFRRLETSPLYGRQILEYGDLSDAAVAALLQRAAGLLMPSTAEGFGLPVAEAAARGCPVAVPSLPVYRELLGAYPVYLQDSDMYSWLQTIIYLASAAPQGAGDAAADSSRQPVVLPGWESHFNRLFILTC